MRRFLVCCFDLTTVVVAWLGAYLLRFNFELPIDAGGQLWPALGVLLIAQMGAISWAGLYRGLWRFASLPDLLRVMRAVAVSAAVLIIYVLALPAEQGYIPRSVVLLYPMLLVMLMAGGRIAWRLLNEYRNGRLVRRNGTPVVVLGAGEVGAMLVRELRHSAQWRVVALLDDDRSKWGTDLQGCTIFGGLDRLPEMFERYKTCHAVIALSGEHKEALQHISQIALRAQARLFTVPSLDQVMSGRVAINSMRPVRIDDLLGREAIRLEDDRVRALLEHKRLLVTGAGGSIGSELCRQLAGYAPTEVVLVESSEFALYTMHQWLSEHYPELRVIPLAADVRNHTAMQEIFRTWRPQWVFHAAAYKHVPLMEAHNAWQAVCNNVFGTWHVASLAQQFGAERFVLISTDKAVNPANVMGATKRMAEMLCQTLQADAPEGTAFKIVRFGNVLGSTGSVIPRFQAQIARGGPITVTHPEITRYFMSIPEAVQLVLQAAVMDETPGRGGEIFVFDMGEPVKIVDLARNMIRLAGFSEKEIPIEFSGLRPGEKLYEELLADAETTLPTPHPKLRIAQPRPVSAELQSYMQTWQILDTPLSDEEVRVALRRWVPEYVPAGSKGGEDIPAGAALPDMQPMLAPDKAQAMLEPAAPGA